LAEDCLQTKANRADRAAPAQEPSLPWWLIGRATLFYILDTIALARTNDGDILDPVITWCIVEANVAAIYQDPVHSHRYATVDAPLPDALRRPISINAVAASLHLPFETVRRRVAEMTATGRCVATPKGVYAPYSALSGPNYDALAMLRYERLRAFYAELKALGALGEVDLHPEGAPRHEAPPVRAANRAILAYMMRVVDEVILRWRDPLRGLVFLEMIRANSERTDALQLAMDTPLPDAARTPVTVAALARRVGLPAETVRRHVARLEADGYCRRLSNGWLADLAQLDQGRGERRGLNRILSAAHFLMGRCAALGVIGYWEGANPAADG
jgi:DNA-binding Lrp family transcriptional regulator